MNGPLPSAPGGGYDVNARLLAIPGGAALWTGSFDENFDDVFAMQDAITQKVATALSLKLDRDERLRIGGAIRPGCGGKIADDRLVADRLGEGRGILAPGGPQQQSFGSREHDDLSSFAPVHALLG